jgi:hypothetical protein
LTISPYLRIAKVDVGPLEEWRGGGNSNLAVSFLGDGTQNSFRIKFNIVKHVVSTGTPSTITIFNLSDGLRKALQKRNIQVSLSVGWANTDLVLLFTGSLLASVSRGAPDTQTDLICMAGYGGTSRTVISQTYSGGMAVKSIVKDLAQKIPGVTIDPKNIDIPEVKRMGAQGFSFAGPVNESLDKLSRVYGFSWHIDNKVFYALSDKTPFGSGTPLISYKNGFLLKVEPILTSPFQIRSGVTINSMLNPAIKPGGRVQVESKLSPELNNTYAAHSVNYSGDTHSNQWECRIESQFFGGA